MYGDYMYPFTAIIGQENLKRAILINLVNPSVGGLLLSGEKGTGKSTIVRSLERLMKDIKVVDLPLNSTEDMLLGGMNIEHALKHGENRINESILMKADSNILYIDEVNLLANNIVDVLLEVSASKRCLVEREGISTSYRSNFTLFASMNPEEGDLRSQFLDRFGLYVELEASEDILERVEIVRSRLDYEDDKESFVEKYRPLEEDLYSRIRDAQEILSQVQIDYEIYKMIAMVCSEAYVSGHRADIYLLEASRAIAALEGRKYVKLEDVQEAMVYVLAHRKRELPESQMEEEKMDEDPEQEEESSEEDKQEDSKEDNKLDEGPESDESDEKSPSDDGNNSDEGEGSTDPMEDQDEEGQENQDSPDEYGGEEKLDLIGESYKLKAMDIKPLDKKKRRGSGKRSLIKTDKKQGRYIRSIMGKDQIKDLAFDATLRVAAPYQKYREKNGMAIAIKKSDIREKLREKRTGTTILFVVDASGSMGAKKRMEAVKGAILSLLTDAYQKRDSVGMIAFRKDKAEILLGITRSVDLAYKELEELPTGGRTPLSLGMAKAYEVLKANMKKDPDIIPIMVLVSDGRSNVSFQGEDCHLEVLEMAEKIYNDGIQSIVIDTEDSFIKLGMAREINKHLNGKYYKLEDLKAEELVSHLKASI